MNTTKPRYAWREVLRDQGRSLSWLADRTSTPRPTVYAYSRGIRRPSNTWLEQVAEALGVPLTDLQGEAA